jgi:hypothetical protein
VVGNIYECGELQKEATCSILELVRLEGKRNVSHAEHQPSKTMDSKPPFFGEIKFYEVNHPKSFIFLQ